MPFFIKLTAATIKELANFVKALDRHRFGALMFILVIIAPGVALALSRAQLVLA
jgi:hypothetical protein